jgi:hypothetical protein
MRNRGLTKKNTLAPFIHTHTHTHLLSERKRPACIVIYGTISFLYFSTNVPILQKNQTHSDYTSFTYHPVDQDLGVEPLVADPESTVRNHPLRRLDLY